MEKETSSNQVDPVIVVTADELRAAVDRFDSLMPIESTALYAAMVGVPEFGIRVVEYFRVAAKAAVKGEYSADRLLDAAVVPAFLMGLLVGINRLPKPETATEQIQTEVAKVIVPHIAPQMDHLGQCVGQKVIVDYVDYGKFRVVTGLLSGVEPFRYIVTTEIAIPFVGFGCAIIQVALAGPPMKVVYHNPYIPDNYDLRSMEKVMALRAKCFGTEHVQILTNGKPPAILTKEASC